MLPPDCKDTFLLNRRAVRRCQQRHHVFLTFPIFLSDFKQIWIFWADFQEGPNLSSGSRVGTCGNTEGRIDMTKVISGFHRALL